MGGAGPFVGSGLAFLLNSVAISWGGMRIKGEAMLTLGSFSHVGSRRAVWAASVLALLGGSVSFSFRE